MDVSILIIILTIIILSIFVVYILYIYKSITIVNTTTQTSSGTTISGVGLVCPVGQCALSLTNGSKICPQLATEQLIADPLTQTCSSQFTCDDARLPYALLSDGSTNLNGVCNQGETCRCVSTATCANQILTNFQIVGGTPYQSLYGQRITVTQNLTDQTVTPSGIPSTVNVFNQTAVSSPITQFCTISADYLSYLSPGTCSSPQDFNISTAAGIAACMRANPCSAGTLAYIPTDINKFDITQISVTPLGCVYGNSTDCDINHLSVWDNTDNQIRCISTV